MANYGRFPRSDLDLRNGWNGTELVETIHSAIPMLLPRQSALRLIGMPPDAISRRRGSGGQPPGHHSPRPVECNPLSDVGQRRDGDDLTLVETGEGSIDQVLRRHHDSSAQVARRKTGDVPELRCDRPRQDGLDAHARACKLMMERLAEGQHK